MLIAQRLRNYENQNCFMGFNNIFLFGINFGNSPLPPPYYKYIVTGSVLCDSLIDKSNFSIQLYGKSNNYQNSYEPILVSGLNYEIPLALTDTSGIYYLNVNNEFFYDSIKVALSINWFS